MRKVPALVKFKDIQFLIKETAMRIYRIVCTNSDLVIKDLTIHEDMCFVKLINSTLQTFSNNNKRVITAIV